MEPWSWRSWRRLEVIGPLWGVITTWWIACTSGLTAASTNTASASSAPHDVGHEVGQPAPPFIRTGGAILRDARPSEYSKGLYLFGCGVMRRYGLSAL